MPLQQRCAGSRRQAWLVRAARSGASVRYRGPTQDGKGASSTAIRIERPRPPRQYDRAPCSARHVRMGVHLRVQMWPTDDATVQRDATAAGDRGGSSQDGPSPWARGPSGLVPSVPFPPRGPLPRASAHSIPNPQPRLPRPRSIPRQAPSRSPRPLSPSLPLPSELSL